MLRYLTAGESHGPALVGIVEGMPAGVPLSPQLITHHLRRRQLGYGRGGRMKIESDTVRILSGVRYGYTIGSPVALLIENEAFLRDAANCPHVMSVEPVSDPAPPVSVPRPGHADLVGWQKYGFSDIRPVIERASARETAMRVACGSVARALLEALGVEVGSHVVQIGSVGYPDRAHLDRLLDPLLRRGAWAVSEAADASPVRCLDPDLSAQMVQQIEEAKRRRDSLGGVFEVWVTGLPPGLGSYVHWDRKLDGRLAQALMSIQAIKGVEVGYGFELAGRYGSEAHDEILIREGRFSRASNRAGGIEGGVSTGEPILLRAAMKPIPTIASNALWTVDVRTRRRVRTRYERSDICTVPAAAVVGEAAVAFTLAQALLEVTGGDHLEEIRQRFESLRARFYAGFA